MPNVYALINNDSDYDVDETIVLAKNLNSPNGVTFKNGDLFVAEIDRILKFPDILRNIQENSDYEVFYNNLPNEDIHGRKYIAFGPDGDLYVPIGAPCNICDVRSPYAALYALNTTTLDLRSIGESIRNTVGFDWNPKTGVLRSTDNGRDRMGDDLPPDELNMVTNIPAHHGYPYCHGNATQDQVYDTRGCEEFTGPVVELGPHVAALGILFLDNTEIQHTRSDHVFVAEHGSCNSTILIGYRISAVDLPTNEYKVFIDGWLQGNEVLGRPVDVAALDDQSILISDDHAGLIYRVWWDNHYSGSWYTLFQQAYIYLSNVLK